MSQLRCRRAALRQATACQRFAHVALDRRADGVQLENLRRRFVAVGDLAKRLLDQVSDLLKCVGAKHHTLGLRQGRLPEGSSGACQDKCALHPSFAKSAHERVHKVFQHRLTWKANMCCLPECRKRPTR
eukprot:6197657-Pleurochrysis_carterae.AAC.12